jgi:ribosomal protein S18 acetylase RimI-like enzyme
MLWRWHVGNKEHNPEFHRHGIGNQMLEHAERSLVADGVELLQVKTLSAAKSDEGYERTRAFYLATGFRPLEELPDLRGPREPCAADGEGRLGSAEGTGRICGPRWVQRAWAARAGHGRAGDGQVQGC